MVFLRLQLRDASSFSGSARGPRIPYTYSCLLTSSLTLATATKSVADFACTFGMLASAAVMGV